MRSGCASTDRHDRSRRHEHRVFQIVALDELVIDRALAAPGSDFEDAIQAAAAFRVAADYLVTRNVGDFGSMGVSLVTPEELLAIIEP